MSQLDIKSKTTAIKANKSINYGINLYLSYFRFK